MERNKYDNYINEIIVEMKEKSVKEIVEMFNEYNDEDKAAVFKTNDIRNNISKEFESIISSNIIIEKEDNDKSTRKNNTFNFKKFIDDTKNRIGDDNFQKLSDFVNEENKADYVYEYYAQKDTDIRQGALTNKVIKKGADYTFLISGTTDIWGKMKDDLQEELSKYYFLPKQNNTQFILDSEKSLNEYIKLLKSKGGIFEVWLGDNNIKLMKCVANCISKKIKSILEEKSNNEKKLTINLIGHSHGGNVLILVINKLLNEIKESKLEIYNLLTLSTPVRDDITLNALDGYHINHIQLYSKKDFVQKIGYIDNDQYPSVLVVAILTGFLGLIPMLCRVLAGHKFPGAVNINFTKLKTESKVKNIHSVIKKGVNQVIQKNKKRVAPYPYHQATRSVGFVEDVLRKSNAM